MYIYISWYFLWYLRGPFRTNNPKQSQKSPRSKIPFKLCSHNYTVKYNESESDIQIPIYNTKYTKNIKRLSNMSKLFEHFGKIQNNPFFILSYVYASAPSPFWSESGIFGVSAIATCAATGIQQPLDTFWAQSTHTAAAAARPSVTANAPPSPHGVGHATTPRKGWRRTYTCTRPTRVRDLHVYVYIYIYI